MVDDYYDNDLVSEGIRRFKAQEYDRARDFFERALSVADDDLTRVNANYYLSRLTDNPIEKRKYLENTLAIDMNHAEARRELAILDGRLKAGEIVDPERIPVPTTDDEVVQANRFTCPNCGGRMVYSPDGASLICESCNRPQSLNVNKTGVEKDFFVGMANGTGFRKTVSAKTFACQGCGANFLLPPSELSASCAYCGSTHVIALEKESELVEPDGIIPMAFDGKQATLQYNHWMDGQKINLQGNFPPPRGLYLPAWIFDIVGSVPWTGKVIRNKRELPVSGEYPVSFNNICIQGSEKLTKLPRTFLDDYKLAEAADYDPRFLAGWSAEVYETPMSDAALDARQSAVERIHHDIRAENGNVFELNYSPSNISITAYRLMLLPVWVMNYSYDGKSYRVIINGQTGTLLGETPSRGLKKWVNNLLGR
jgi:DNA-directed RNA polymerase subunit RPC12/RpoP